MTCFNNVPPSFQKATLSLSPSLQYQPLIPFFFPQPFLGSTDWDSLSQLSSIHYKMV